MVEATAAAVAEGGQAQGWAMAVDCTTSTEPVALPLDLNQPLQSDPAAVQVKPRMSEAVAALLPCSQNCCIRRSPANRTFSVSKTWSMADCPTELAPCCVGRAVPAVPPFPADERK